MNFYPAPEITDKFTLKYMRLCNKRPPGDDEKLHEEWARLLSQKAKFERWMDSFFERCDGAELKLLQAELEQTKDAARENFAKQERMRTLRGLYGSKQADHTTRLEQLHYELRGMRAINRTIATDAELEAWDTEYGKRREAVQEQLLIVQNHRAKILRNDESLSFLGREFNQLAAKVESLEKRIAQLKLPPDQRSKPPSSVHWTTTDGSTFGLQLPS